MLYNVSALPMRLSDLDQVGKLAVDQAVDLLGSDKAIYYRFEADSLRPLAARGLGLDKLAEIPVDETRPALARALAAQRPTVWPQAEAPEIPNLLGELYAVRAALCVPVRLEDELVGLIYAVRHQAHPFSAAEETLFTVLAGRLAEAIDNAQAFQALERRVADLQILNQIGQSLSQALDLDTLLQSIHQQVDRVLDASSFLISLYERESHQFVDVYVMEKGEPLPVARRPADQGLTGHIISTRQPLLLSTQDENTAFLQAQGLELVGEQAKCWLGVPLVAGDEVVGVMAVQNYEQEGLYDEQDVSLFATIAAQAAVALENASLFRQAEQARREQLAHTEQLKTLHQVILALTEEQRDLNAVMDILTQQAMGLLECDGGGLWLWQEDKEALELVFEIQAEAQDMVGRQLEPGEGLVGTAFADKKMLAIDDYQTWEGRATAFDYVPFVSALAAPMTWHDRVFGVLTFNRSQKQPFSEDERYLADFLATQAGAVLQNVRFFDEMQRSLRRAQALYRAGRTLIEFESVEQALKAAAEGAAEGIGADMALINVIDMGAKTLEHVVAGGPEAPETFEKAPFEEMWQGLSGLALRELEAVFSPKWMMPDPRESPEAQQRRVEFGAGSLILVPMQYRGEILGTLTALNQLDSPDFNQRDVNLVVAIANQAAAAVMNARLVQQMRANLAQIERRALQLGTASEVARAVSTVLDLDELLPQVVQVIKERFDLYYAGLFLLDKAGRWAVLRAGTGEAGQAMLAAGHKLMVGGESMIGDCVARGEARIALDVGEEAVRFKNPHLPHTHSEMALPLISRGRVIGAMSIQSERRAAFSEGDITALQTMADQIAVAIDNARLFAESQAAVEEVEAVQRRYIEEAWVEYMRDRAVSGYEQSAYGLKALQQELLPEVKQALEAQDVIVRPDSAESGQEREATLVVPIMLRGQPIGALGLKGAEGERQWNDDDVALAQALSQQLALAAENLRLIEETRRRATREELIGQITARMRRTLDLDMILQTATREMREVLNLAEAEVWIGAGLMEEEQDGQSIAPIIEEE